MDPNQALTELLQPTSLRVTLFPPNSRYHGIEVAIREEQPGGPKTAYLRRRFCPQADQLATLAEHYVVERDRLDHLAFRYLGDAELFWRICDANAGMRPAELTETVGRRLRITLPEGFPALAGTQG